MPSHPLNATRLSPSMTVNDLQKSIRFYTEGLGFEIASKHEVDGVVRFVMLKAGAAEIGIGQDDFGKGKDRVKGIGSRIWINTQQDLAPIAASVKAAGFKLNSEPAPLEWGPMAFTVTDPDGFMISVSNG
jgi:uncharacterized glyoxalase superfamily protein PhnB